MIDMAGRHSLEEILASIRRRGDGRRRNGLAGVGKDLELEKK